MTTYNTRGSLSLRNQGHHVDQTKQNIRGGCIKGGRKEDDLGALIYRESQLRKKEAATVDRAKKRKKSTSSSSRR